MISVVKATTEHLPRILEIGIYAISSSWTFDFLFTELSNGDSHFLVALDNSVVGFVILRQVGDDGEILQIAVDRKTRRSGVGDLLMEAALNYTRERELESLFLEVRKSNTAALALYEKHGFKAMRTRKNYYNDPTEDAIVMVLQV